MSGRILLSVGLLIAVALLAISTARPCLAEESAHSTVANNSFPPDLQSYGDTGMSILEQLAHRIKTNPFNLVATIIFALAIVHSFLTARFRVISHSLRQAHEEKIERGDARLNSVSHRARLFHFLGEVEVVFGLWCIPLLIGIVIFFDWPTAVEYVSHKVNYTEAMFVVVIMTIASTRPILKLSEAAIGRIASRFGGSLGVWWLTILTIGPLLGSFITEPAAMTICALLLVRKFYPLQASRQLKYATLGLLFVNISVGGTLTHFAAPPVLMVSEAWGWGTGYMLLHFGWKAAIGIVVSNALYWFVFRGEFAALRREFELRELKDQILTRYLPRETAERALTGAVAEIAKEQGDIGEEMSGMVDGLASDVKERLRGKVMDQLDEIAAASELVMQAFDQRFEEIKRYRLQKEMPHLLPKAERAPFTDPRWDEREDTVPAWITIVHVAFMAWTIVNSHHAVLFVAGLLFLLGFAAVTADFQNRIDLKQPLLVGFFLGGLVTHGGIQGWWIAPVLSSFGENQLTVAATVLTSVNDNAAIAYLATLVPGFTDGMKYAVIAGAVTGGGLTVIANAPNPAGQAILNKHFGKHGITPIGLLIAALVPTVIMFLAFSLL